MGLPKHRKSAQIPEIVSGGHRRSVCGTTDHISSLTDYRVGQKVSHFVYIFAKYMVNFHNILTSGLCKKFATQWHAHRIIMSLHYLVKYGYPKKYNTHKRT